MSETRGRFVWYELNTTDVKGAEDFYDHVIGWNSRDAGMEKPYTLFTVGAGESAPMMAGLMETPPEAKAAGAPPSWTGYIKVDDVDGDARHIAEGGGKTWAGPMDIPGVGRLAVVSDPQGAAFALFKPMSDDPPAAQPAPGAPGTAGWHELHAVDWAGAAKWYSSFFGWTLTETLDMGPAGKYQLFTTTADQGGGIFNKMPERPVPFWLYYFNIEDINAGVARVKAKGGQVIHGPMEVPGGSWIANCIDPQGAFFALASPPKG